MVNPSVLTSSVLTSSGVTADVERQFPPRRTIPRPASRRLWGITAKLGLLSGGLVLILITAVGAVLLQTNQTTHEYDRLLAAQVSDGLAARRIQVEFKRQVQEWKDILLRGANPDDLTTYTTNFRRQDGLVGSLTDALIAGTTDPRVRADLIRFRTGHQQLDAAYQRALAGFVASGGKDFVTADRMVRGLDRPPTALLDDVVTHLSDTIQERIAQQKATATARQRVGLVATLVLLGVLAVLVTAVVRRLVHPIRGLTAAARQVADESLPAVITQIKAMPADAALPTLPAFQVDSRDELNDLAEAFSRVQASAVRLATEQHRAERESAEMLVNLGRRNQNLLSRLLSQVSDLERTERDPDVLAQLFRLDHAATRIRRNAESMLVLAGATQTRTFSVPVPFEDIIRAALSEIEDYVRVDLYHIEDGLISGSAAADVVHLLAELIENATHFSPPHSQVTVVGQRVRTGYRIRVIDQGVGMTHRELTEANERILRATRGWADAKLLGLYVVGRLATRRGIEVSLEPSASRGITATVLIPAAATAPDSHGVTGAAPEVVPVRGDRLPPGERLRPRDQAERQPIGGTRPALPVQPAAARRPDERLPASGHPARSAAPAGDRIARPADPTPQPADPTAQPADPRGGPPAMPKRVRGAQLTGLDLGGPETEGSFTPPPEWSHFNLRSLQLDVEAARRAIADQGPDDWQPGSAGPRGSARRPPDPQGSTPLPGDAEHAIDVRAHERSYDRGQEGR